MFLSYVSENQPNVMEDLPPGGACTLVVGRSVMKFPQFWFDPLANRFEDTPLLAVARTVSFATTGVGFSVTRKDFILSVVCFTTGVLVGFGAVVVSSPNEI